MKRIASLREKSNDQLRSRLIDINATLMRAVGKVKAGGQYSEDSMFMENSRKKKLGY